MKTRTTIFLSSSLTIVITLIAVLLMSTNNARESENKAIGFEKPYRDIKLRIQIITSTHGTYGYEIIHSGKVVIHQPHIPAVPGNSGFKTKEDAKKVADLVVEKIQRNIFPPSISLEELDSLGLLGK